MKAKRSATGYAKSSAGALAGTSVLVVLALGGSTAALAGDVYWSVGLSSPGVQLGVFSPQPVYVQPQPVYVQPQVVYVQPQPYYVQPRTVYVQPQVVYTQPGPVYVQPRPVYLQPQPQVVYNGWNHPRHGWHHGPRPYPAQVVQTYPVQYQMPVDGGGFIRR